MTAALIAHLVELDARRLYLAEGCASLFTYCVQVLHLSEHAAYERIQAARASRKFPVILEMFRVGSVNLSTVCLLAPHLTPESYREVLDMARHRTKRQVEELVARLRPQPPVPDMIRKLPARVPEMTHKPTPSSAAQDAAPDRSPDGDTQSFLCAGQPAAESPPPPARRSVVTPLAPQQFKIQFTADAALHDKLRQAQALLRHQIPDGDLCKIFDRALTALLQDLAKKKLAATERPRAGPSIACGSRHIPAAVRRAVWHRDGGRCSSGPTMVAAAPRRRSWSSITSCRTRSGDRPPPRTFSCGAVPTTDTKPSVISAGACASACGRGAPPIRT